MNLLPILADKFLRFRLRRFHAIEGFLTDREAVALHRRLVTALPGNAATLEAGSWKDRKPDCIASDLRRLD